MDARQKAFTEHYNKKEKFSSIKDAQAQSRKGQHILKVNPITDILPFYTIHNFDRNINSWIHPGCVIGMWNELEVILKIK